MTGPVTSVAFLFAASRAIGGGHAMRCLTLAQALAAQGARVLLACPQGTSEAVPALVRSGLPLLAVPGSGAFPAAEAFGEALGPVDVAVVDSYAVGAGFHQACRAWAGRVMVIDDLADRAYGADLLADFTPGRGAQAFAGLVPPAATLALGPAYAPLRPAFAEGRRRSLRERAARKGKIERLVVTPGLVDSPNLAAAVLDGLEREGFRGTVDIVLGRAAPHRQAIAARLRPGWQLHVDTDDVAGLLAQADLAIGTGGMSSWERCALGLPTLLLVGAANQRANAAALAALGAALVLDGPDLPASVATRLAALQADPAAVEGLSAAAALACDGLGANRLAGLLLPTRTPSGKPVTLRPAGEGDVELMFRWQSDPVTRRYARNPEPPSWDGHVAWCRRRLSDPLCLFTIVELDGMPAGVARLDPLADGDDAYEVSILTAPGAHGQGVGKAALRALRRLVPHADIFAAVLPGNEASRRLFQSAGYQPAPGGFRSPPVPPESPR